MLCTDGRWLAFFCIGCFVHVVSLISGGGSRTELLDFRKVHHKVIRWRFSCMSCWLLLFTSIYQTREHESHWKGSYAALFVLLLFNSEFLQKDTLRAWLLIEQKVLVRGIKFLVTSVMPELKNVKKINLSTSKNYSALYIFGLCGF